MTALFKDVTREERLGLHSFILDQHGQSVYSSLQMEVIKALPIFETYNGLLPDKEVSEKDDETANGIKVTSINCTRSTILLTSH